MDEPWNISHAHVKVLDCTIRDGGLMNSHRFDDQFVRTVYRTCIQAGVDLMEIGYKNSDSVFARDTFGHWMHCREDDVRRVLEEMPLALPLSAMVDAGKSNWKTDIIAKEKSIFSVMRVAFYAHQVPEALEMIQAAYQQGYQVWANLMAVSSLSEMEIDQALERLAPCPAKVLVVVDSFGAMFPETVEYLVKKYLRFGKETNKDVGIHAHNNQQLAFANSIAAVAHGANYVDASLGGLGRGAGNCPMELLLGYLKNPKHRLRPVYEALDSLIEPLRQKIDWGPSPEYNITGQHNMHPRSAMAVREKPEQKITHREFFDQMNADPMKEVR